MAFASRKTQPEKLQLEKTQPVVLYWFRRDLRLFDNTGLEAALKFAQESNLRVLPFFLFDTRILSKLEDRNDRRVDFIHRALQSMQDELVARGSTLLVETGDPRDVFEDLFQRFNIKAVYLNHDYEPYATERDLEVRKIVRQAGAEFVTFKDQVIFEKVEIEKGTGGPYSVFTPYSRRWLSRLKPEMLRPRKSEDLVSTFRKAAPLPIPSLKQIGFKAPSTESLPSRDLSRKIVRTYEDTRNIPAIAGTTRMGAHLRFGTVSVRQLVKEARKYNEVWLGELIWREFFMQILWNYPDVVKGPFRHQYGNIKYLNRESDFQAWCEGRTGYPIVDAGMRELNETGFMHNRVRMVAASFLVKHLLVDWRMGEAYFARKLLDFELASNNGNWQWVAGCGCDATPFFRVFNPIEQLRKFDRNCDYVKKWVREFETENYPAPIVEHKMARERVLKVYKDGLYGHS